MVRIGCVRVKAAEDPIPGLLLTCFWVVIEQGVATLGIWRRDICIGPQPEVVEWIRSPELLPPLPPGPDRQAHLDWQKTVDMAAEQMLKITGMERF